MSVGVGTIVMPMPPSGSPINPASGASRGPAANVSGEGASIAVVGEHGFLIHAVAVMLAKEGGFEVVELLRPLVDAGRELRRAQVSAAIVGLTQMAPDVALAEVRALATIAPQTALIAIIRSPDPVLTRDALRAGARACITRRSTTQEFFDAVYRVLDGNSYVSPVLALALANFAETNGPADLSLREKEVLRLVGLGLTNREIARVMHLSVRTVETHRASVQRKLGTTRRADLVSFAASFGLLG